MSADTEELPAFEAWSDDKCAAFKEAFLEFLNHATINSKDKGQIPLGKHIYRAQLLLLDEILEGLKRGIHHFYILKSRQLGMSTFCRALTLFWNGIHDGLHGSLVLDTDANKEKARLELLAMVESLPPRLDFPRIKHKNRYLLELSNGSVMEFGAAGVRQGKASGAFGRSTGINFAHLSELCSFDNQEGLESFMNALSEEFPDRLYLFESTARGYNQWHEMWDAARADPHHCKCIFLGWWSKDNQMISRNHPDFERYGLMPPTDAELKKIKSVKERYGWDITPEQLAWVRRKYDPTAQSEGDADPDFSGDVLKLQEQPWDEEDAFQVTGATFFEPEDLTQIEQKTVSKKFNSYSYSTGIEFTDCKVYKAHNAKSVQLKVWEEPEDDGVYIIAADPAFGHSDRSDRSAIQVLRAYADGLDQVAEYAWPLINTRQFAWVIASLLGWYGNCYFILEINGPGESVLQELQTLKRQMQYGYQPDEMNSRGLMRIFNNVKNYLYGRVDSMAPGRNLHWKTSHSLKVSIMERLRDFVSNTMLVIRSHDTVEEMKSITREGDSIEAQGSKKDDRVMSLAMAVRCWDDRVRRLLIAEKRTRANERARKKVTLVDQIQMMNQMQLENFFARKAAVRRHAAREARRAAWGARR